MHDISDLLFISLHEVRSSLLFIRLSAENLFVHRPLSRLSIVPDQVAGLIKYSYYFKPISNIIIIFVSRSFVFLTYSPVPTTSAFLFNIFRSFLHITCSVRYTGAGYQIRTGESCLEGSHVTTTSILHNQ